MLQTLIGTSRRDARLTVVRPVATPSFSTPPSTKSSAPTARLIPAQGYALGKRPQNQSRAEGPAHLMPSIAPPNTLAIRLSRTITIAALVEELKTSSSKWVKTQSPALAAFSWQRGYGCFSVGPSDLDALKAYIDDQENHHRTRTFQEEFRMFLKKYGVEYNEAYVWD